MYGDSVVKATPRPFKVRVSKFQAGGGVLAALARTSSFLNLTFCSLSTDINIDGTKSSRPFESAESGMPPILCVSSCHRLMDLVYNPVLTTSQQHTGSVFCTLRGARCQVSVTAPCCQLSMSLICCSCRRNRHIMIFQLRAQY